MRKLSRGRPTKVVVISAALSPSPMPRMGVPPARAQPRPWGIQGLSIGHLEVGYDLAQLLRRDGTRAEQQRHLAGDVDDGGGHVARGGAAVQVDGDRVAEHLLRGVAVL